MERARRAKSPINFRVSRFNVSEHHDTVKLSTRSSTTRESNRTSERCDRKTHIADVSDRISPLKNSFSLGERAKNRERSTISHQRPGYLAAVNVVSRDALRRDPPFIKTLAGRSEIKISVRNEEDLTTLRAQDCAFTAQFPSDVS